MAADLSVRLLQVASTQRVGLATYSVHLVWQSTLQASKGIASAESSGNAQVLRA